MNAYDGRTRRNENCPRDVKHKGRPNQAARQRIFLCVFRRKRTILADAAAEFLCFAFVAFDFRVGRVIVNRLEVFGGDEIGKNALVGV